MQSPDDIRRSCQRFGDHRICEYIFKDRSNEWTDELSKIKGDNIILPSVNLIGSDLRKVLAGYTQGSYFAVVLHDNTGEARYLQKTFFKSLRSHSYDDKKREIYLHESGITLNVSEAIQYEDKGWKDGKREYKKREYKKREDKKPEDKTPEDGIREGEDGEIFVHDPRRLFYSDNNRLRTSVITMGWETDEYLDSSISGVLDGPNVDRMESIAKICCVRIRHVRPGGFNVVFHAGEPSQYEWVREDTSPNHKLSGFDKILGFRRRQ